MNRILANMVGLSLCVAFAMGCGDDEDLDSDSEARLAYLGFDAAIDRALNLGFDGFNAASSANIPVQSGVGAVDGTMDVGGQVDQGASANKQMRLEVTVVAYTDGTTVDPDTDEEFEIVYDTPLDTPLLVDLSLKNIPNGTFTGTVLGTLIMAGDVHASADFNLVLSGEIESSPTDAEKIVRKAGTLIITGTATSGDGVYDVDVTR